MRPFVGLCTSLSVQSVLSLTFKSEEVEANFDDRIIAPGATQLDSVGAYGRLQWSGFSIGQPNARNGDNEFVGVEVKSEPNYAGGRVDFFGGLPTMTATYPGSNIAFFDLEKFWWGCSLTADSEALPGWCTLEVNGYARDAKVPVAQALSFFFPEEDTRSMAMVECHLPSTFNAVNRVEFNVIATKTPVLYLDDVQYKVYNVTDMGRGLGEVIHSSETSQSEFVLQVRGFGRYDGFAGRA